MQASDISILVVDDSESATNLIEQVLFNGDFYNLHFCKGAVDAMQFLEENPTHILLTEWALEDVDGIELTQHVRELDEGKAHHTYTIIFSDQEPDTRLKEAFRSSVDGFLRKRDLHSHLLGMIYAAERLTRQVNRVMAENIQLHEEAGPLRAGQLLDPLTGLGNRRMAEQCLADVIRQIEARGGAVCYLLIGVGNYAEIVREKSQRIADELIYAIAKRLANLIRPLDVASYLGDGRFALVLMQPTIEQCTPGCYRRIHEGVSLKSYKTTAGYFAAVIGTSISASEALTGPPNPSTLIKLAEAGMQEAYKTGEIQVQLLGEGAN